jgi:hypothetical protein
MTGAKLRVRRGAKQCTGSGRVRDSLPERDICDARGFCLMRLSRTGIFLAVVEAENGCHVTDISNIGPRTPRGKIECNRITIACAVALPFRYFASRFRCCFSVRFSVGQLRVLEFQGRRHNSRRLRGIQYSPTSAFIFECQGEELLSLDFQLYEAALFWEKVTVPLAITKPRGPAGGVNLRTPRLMTYLLSRSSQRFLCFSTPTSSTNFFVRFRWRAIRFGLA